MIQRLKGFQPGVLEITRGGIMGRLTHMLDIFVTNHVIGIAVVGGGCIRNLVRVVFVVVWRAI